MKKILFGLVVLFSVTTVNANTAIDTIPSFKNLNDSASYALGYNIGQTVAQRFGMMDKEIVMKGLLDAANKMPSVLDVNLTQGLINQCLTNESEKASIGNIKEGEAYMAENKTKSGVIQTASGLQYKVIKMGNGAKPSGADMVKVNYEGRLLNGKVFDASNLHGGPAQFGVNGVIAGWTEVLKLMPVGSKFQVIIPSKLGYGMQGSGADIKPGHTLDFDIELLEIVKATPPPTTKPATKPTISKPNVKPVVKPTIKRN
jgi:FKBP-type peptidyl-prolyl cis-trans isomerase FklB